MKIYSGASRYSAHRYKARLGITRFIPPGLLGKREEAFWTPKIDKIEWQHGSAIIARNENNMLNMFLNSLFNTSSTPSGRMDVSDTLGSQIKRRSTPEFGPWNILPSFMFTSAHLWIMRYMLLAYRRCWLRRLRVGRVLAGNEIRTGPRARNDALHL